jgi:putative SOS response-associated peptidase YedK
VFRPLLGLESGFLNMCGRFVITSAPEALKALFGYGETPNFPPRFNVAPTQPVPVISQKGAIRHFRLMRWGFIPAWSKDPAKFALVINARSETIREKPAFRNAIRRRRCLIPADGYYEWQSSGVKRPFFIHAASQRPMAFAAVAETWMGPNGEEVDTVAIVTVAAGPDLAWLHHRTPVIVPTNAFSLWLDCSDENATEVDGLMAAPAAGALAWHEISKRVNQVVNDDAELLQPFTNPDEVKPSAKPRARPVDDAQGSLF